MKCQFFSQPDGALTLAEWLRAQLNQADPGWLVFRAAVAFAKRSGVSQIFDDLALFASRAFVRISVGVDLRGTSREGLQDLLDAVEVKGGEIWIYHNAHRQRPTFHPKVYLFKNHAAARIYIGSGNLTAGGLVSNTEVGMILEVDQTNRSDSALLLHVEEALDIWCEPARRLAHRLTPELLKKLVAEGLVPNEAAARGDEAFKGIQRGKWAAGRGGKIFGSVSVPTPIRTRRTSGRKKARPGSLTKFGRHLRRGPVVWQKQDLRGSDAQRTKPGSHPVGGVRLTQARYRDAAGRLIDQRSYFRRRLFGGFDWTTVKKKPYEEGALVPFDVTFMGRSRGFQQLKVSHKPSGEAGQGNYTTILHWGPLAQVLRDEIDLTGRTLTLYGPPVGKTDPFFLEVI